MHWDRVLFTVALTIFSAGSALANHCDYNPVPYVGAELGALSTERLGSLAVRALVAHFPALADRDGLDLVMLFQAPYINVYEKLQTRLIQAQSEFEVPHSNIELCYLTDLTRPKAYEAFFDIEGNFLAPNNAVISFIAPTARPSKDMVTTPPPTEPESADYPWVRVEQTRAALPNLPGLISLRSECSSNEDFAILATGQVAEEPSGELYVTNLIGVTRNFGASVDPTSRTSVESSVYFGDYWCPQKKEFCYKYLADGAFGVPAGVGQTIAPDDGRIYALSEGLVSAFALLMTDNCPRNDNQ